MNKKIGKRGFLGQKMIVLPNAIQNRLQQNSITKQFYITDIGYYPKAKGHFINRKKGSKEYIFIYNVEGRGTINFQNINIELQPNTYCIIPINVPHSYEAHVDDPWSIYWIHFRGELCASLYQRHLEATKVSNKIPFENQRISKFTEIFEMLSSEYNSTHLEYANILGLSFLSNFIYPEPDNNSTNLNTTRIENITDYLYKNLHKSLKTEEIAQQFNYSPSYILHLFKKNTGYSLIQFFNLKKVQKACEYLKYTDLSIKEISFKLGFQDPLYFSRMFKKYMGDSPTDYKKENA